MHAFDRRTDGQTDSFLLTRPPCIPCSAVTKMQPRESSFGNISIVAIFKEIIEK